MLLSSIIQTFEAEFLATYQNALLPSQRKALTALKLCRTTQSPVMLAQCDGCEKQIFIPHSCGHRNCPHCQHHESQQWLERQLQKQVSAEYFLLTFTLPAELRPLAWQHQRTLYDLMIRCSWETLKTFAKVFRAKLLDAITQEGIPLPPRYPETWVVDVKSVGSGDKALVYLGRYLYKGVIQEKDIIACKEGLVTFRYQDSKTKKMLTRTLPGAQFLWLIFQHVLPKGFRRTRNFGFLHASSKRLLALLQELLRLNPIKIFVVRALRPTIKCPCCGGAMRIVKTRIPALSAFGQLAPSG